MHHPCQIIWEVWEHNHSYKPPECAIYCPLHHVYYQELVTTGGGNLRNICSHGDCSSQGNTALILHKNSCSTKGSTTNQVSGQCPLISHGITLTPAMTTHHPPNTVAHPAEFMDCEEPPGCLHPFTSCLFKEYIQKNSHHSRRACPNETKVQLHQHDRQPVPQHHQ